MHKVGDLEEVLADSSEDKSIGIFFVVCFKPTVGSAGNLALK